MLLGGNLPECSSIPVQMWKLQCYPVEAVIQPPTVFYRQPIFVVLQSPGVCWQVETRNAIVKCMIRLACGEVGYRGLGGLNERLGRSGPRRR
jgi:hypothetical protein